MGVVTHRMKLLHYIFMTFLFILSISATRRPNRMGNIRDKLRRQPLKQLDCADYKPGKNCQSQAYHPKCGNNGRTYRNRCAILKQKCKNGRIKGNRNLKIDYLGEC